MGAPPPMPYHPQDTTVSIKNRASQPSTENALPLDQQETFTDVSVALARNMPNNPPTLQTKILQGEFIDFTSITN